MSDGPTQTEASRVNLVASNRLLLHRLFLPVASQCDLVFMRTLISQSNCAELCILKMNVPPTQAASCVIKDDFNRLLLIKRANPPQQGRWSLPGGRVEAQESLESAARREAREETGLDVEIIMKLGSVNLGVDEGYNYEVHHFLARTISGNLQAGDDAADVGWFSTEALNNLELSTDLLKYLAPYQVL